MQGLHLSSRCFGVLLPCYRFRKGKAQQSAIESPFLGTVNWKAKHAQATGFVLVNLISRCLFLVSFRRFILSGSGSFGCQGTLFSSFFSEVCMTPAAFLVKAQVDICCEGTGHTHRPFSFNFKILASTRCWHQFWCEPLQYPPISSLHLICPRSIRIKQVVSGNKSISHLHFLTMPSTLLFDKGSQCNFYLESGAWGGFHWIGQWHPLQQSCVPAQSTLEGFGKQVLSLRLHQWHICIGSRINQAGCVRSKFRCHILGWNSQVGWSALMDLWSGMTSHSLVSWCQCLRWAWRSWPCSQTSQVFSHLRLHFHWVSKPGGMSQTSGTFFPFSGSSFQMHVSWFNGGNAETLACNFPKSFASLRRWQRPRLPRLCAVVIEKHSKQLMADLACLCSRLRHAGFVSKTCDWHLCHRPWPFDLSETKSRPHDVWSWGCHMKGLREQNLELYEIGQSMMEKLFCVAVLLCNSIKQLRNPSSPLRFHLKDSKFSLTNAGSFKTFRRRER